MRWRLSFCMMLMGALLAGPAIATELGDPAPALQVKDWVKGKPVDLKAGKGKNVYVVEFWATWCGPCRVSIPHLTELQKKYQDKGVVVVGISDESLDDVKPFVEKMGDKMNYVVAVDDGKKTNKAYMEAFEVNVIPQAFIVDKSGILVWQGNPLEGMDKALDAIIAGKHDLEAAKKADQERRRITRLLPVLTEYFKLVEDGDEEDADKAADLGKKLLKEGGTNSGLMNQLAWTILDTPDLKHRDLDLAMKAAKAAYEGCKGKNPAIVDTYARALWETGKKAEAIKYQKKAVKLCEDKTMAKELKKTLKQYKKKMAKEKEKEA